jgi:HK97 family phage major capsid protein
VVNEDLRKIIGIEIDRAAVNGSGSGSQPRGILQTSGIGAVVGGTNGLAPAWSHIVGLETAVAVDDADVGSLGYLSNAAVRGKLKQVFRNATYGEVPIWGDGKEPGRGLMNGYTAYASNNVPSNLTKGSSSEVCSAIIFGNWKDLIIGFWGTGLDILLDPYTGVTSGRLRIRAMIDLDIGVKNAQSFAAMLDALTA